MVVVSSHQLVELDANFLVAVLTPTSRQSRDLRHWLESGLTVQISAVAWSEYLCGPLEPHIVPAARDLVSVVDGFTERDAELASDLFNKTGRRSRSHVDCMLAAHAIGRAAVLATLNFNDFRRFERFGLRIASRIDG